MNTNIKILLIILIHVIFQLKVSTQEIIIKVPEKFNEKVLPLPPFPLEIISQLNVENLDNNIDNIEIRSVDIDKINYKYWYEFLNNTVHKKSQIYQSISIDTNFEDITLGHSIDYQNNNFDFTAFSKVGISMNPLNLYIGFKEFRLPFILIAEFEELYPSITLKDQSYDYYWSFYLSNRENNSIKIKYKGNYRLNYLLEFNYVDKNIYGSGGLGYDFFKIGLSFQKLVLFPYLDIYLKLDPLLMKFETLSLNNVMDYRISMHYKKNNMDFSLLLGSLIDNEYRLKTGYLSIGENLFWGKREYSISANDFRIVSSFINGNFTGIIEFNMDFINSYIYLVGIKYRDIFRLDSSLTIKNNTIYEVGIKFRYNLGEK